MDLPDFPLDILNIIFNDDGVLDLRLRARLVSRRLRTNNSTSFSFLNVCFHCRWRDMIRKLRLTLALSDRCSIGKLRHLCYVFPRVGKFNLEQLTSLHTEDLTVIAAVLLFCSLLSSLLFYVCFLSLLPLPLRSSASLPFFSVHRALILAPRFFNRWSRSMAYVYQRTGTKPSSRYIVKDIY